MKCSLMYIQQCKTWFLDTINYKTETWIYILCNLNIQVEPYLYSTIAQYINQIIWFDLKIQYNLIGTTKISDLRMVMRSLFFSRIKIIFWKVLRMDILIYIFYLPWSDNFDLFELPSMVGSGHNSDVIQEMDDS